VRLRPVRQPLCLIRSAQGAWSQSNGQGARLRQALCSGLALQEALRLPGCGGHSQPSARLRVPLAQPLLANYSHPARQPDAKDAAGRLAAILQASLGGFWGLRNPPWFRPPADGNEVPRTSRTRRDYCAERRAVSLEAMA